MGLCASLGAYCRFVHFKPFVRLKTEAVIGDRPMLFLEFYVFLYLGLSPEIVRAVTERGYDQPTPQFRKQAIPVVLAGGDIMAGSANWYW